MIPHQNVQDLMLHREVVEAVEAGKFHIYAVGTIDEGIEILTGVKAGEKKANGLYEADTVNGLVDDRLREFSSTWKRYTVGG
jgi:ATP-dependent Lon protease